MKECPWAEHLASTKGRVGAPSDVSTFGHERAPMCVHSTLRLKLSLCWSWQRTKGRVYNGATNPSPEGYLAEGQHAVCCNQEQLAMSLYVKPHNFWRYIEQNFSTSDLHSKERLCCSNLYRCTMHLFWPYTDQKDTTGAITSSLLVITSLEFKFNVTPHKVMPAALRPAYICGGASS